MAITKVKEIIETSPNSFDEALKEAIKHITEEKQLVSGVKVVGHTVDIKNGEITEYKVNVKYAYRWEKELQAKE